MRYEMPKRVSVKGRGVRAIHSGVQLIAATRAALGLEPAWQVDTVGQRELAAWMVAKRAFVEGTADVKLHPILERGELLARIVGGDVVPCEEVAQALASLTLGAVVPEMFEVAVERVEAMPAGAGIGHNGGPPIEEPACPHPSAALRLPPSPQVGEGDSEIAAVRAATGAGARQAQRNRPAPASIAPAVLGAVPPGRLFVAWFDGEGRTFVIDGLGITVRLDLAAMLGLHAATSAALAESLGPLFHQAAA